MIIGTCGHEVTDLGNHIAVKDTDREGNPTTSYIVVCTDCLRWYQKKNLIAKGEK